MKGVDMGSKPEIMTVAETAAFLKVLEETVWDWINEGELKALNLGEDGVRIRYGDICAFLRMKVVTEGYNEKRLQEHLALLDKTEGHLG